MGVLGGIYLRKGVFRVAPGALAGVGGACFDSGVCGGASGGPSCGGAGCGVRCFGASAVAGAGAMRLKVL